ncbi:MAG: hypothetical protein F6J98_28170 [Moorea sp. SIO4G2]|nr:hypothetical protein [Moorena sp. SIO4G2]
MQSLMGETTAVAHGGNPQDRAAFPRPRCIPDIAFIGLMRYTLFFTSSLFPAPCSRLDAKREWGKPRQSASGLFAFAFGVAYGQAWPTAKLP